MADYENRRDSVEQFNKDNAWRKRGISINPCRSALRTAPASECSRLHDRLCQAKSSRA